MLLNLSLSPHSHLSDPCDALQCQYGATCVRHANNTASCVCPSCNLHYQPVCGNDGLSYFSECFLFRKACLAGTTLTMVYRGRCCKWTFFWTAVINVIFDSYILIDPVIIEFFSLSLSGHQLSIWVSMRGP